MPEKITRETCTVISSLVISPITSDFFKLSDILVSEETTIILLYLGWILVLKNLPLKEDVNENVTSYGNHNIKPKY